MMLTFNFSTKKNQFVYKMFEAVKGFKIKSFENSVANRLNEALRYLCTIYSSKQANQIIFDRNILENTYSI